jgi:hypothetical protein
VILTLVSEETADPISVVVQAESLKSLTVFPFTTPPTLIVGVESRPGELPGVTKDKDDGAEGAVVTITPPPPPLESPPLQEARIMREQKTEGDFQPQELNAKTKPNDRMTE